MRTISYKVGLFTLIVPVTLMEIADTPPTTFIVFIVMWILMQRLDTYKETREDRHGEKFKATLACMIGGEIEKLATAIKEIKIEATECPSGSDVKNPIEDVANSSLKVWDCPQSQCGQKLNLSTELECSCGYYKSPKEEYYYVPLSGCPD